MAQDQNINESQIADSQVQLTQATRDAIGFQNSNHNQTTINNITLRLFGQSASTSVDWAWAKRLLEQKQLPEIRKRLTDTLGRDRSLISIGLEEQLTWVGRSPLEAPRRLQVQGQDQGAIDLNQMLIETFGRDDIAGKLLILGTPGAGKTTALLSLAEQLVCGALAQPKTVIPVLFELSTWRDDRQSIETWLIEQLCDLHERDRRKAKRYRQYKQWLEQQVLLPLLDGLDELGLERQKQCTLKLNEFARYYPQLVVCCRVKEFKQADIMLTNLNNAVCLEPLSDAQIQTYLETVQRPQFWDAIQFIPIWRDLLEPTPEGEPGLLRLPLFVTLAASAYDPQRPFQTKTELLEQFIDRQLSRDVREGDRRKEIEHRDWAYKTPELEPDRQPTQRTLRWIARQLQQNNTVELLIEHIQPSWLETQQARQRYRLIGGLVLGLLLGLLFELLLQLLLGPVGGLLVGLLGGLLLGRNDIRPVEAFNISISHNVRQEIVERLKEWLLVGLFVGLLGGLLVGLVFGLLGGLISGLCGGLLGGLISGLLGGLKQDLQLRSCPNQGIWNSLQNLRWTTILTYPIGLTIPVVGVVISVVLDKGSWTELPGILLMNSPRFLLAGLLMSLVFGFLLGGGLACVQHVCLRFVLWQSGVAPWNLARFLNYCVERRLLQRVGGRYRFLHRELLDHFAGQPPTV